MGDMSSIVIAYRPVTVSDSGQKRKDISVLKVIKTVTNVIQRLNFPKLTWELHQKETTD